MVSPRMAGAWGHLKVDRTELTAPPGIARAALLTAVLSPGPQKWRAVPGGLVDVERTGLSEAEEGSAKCPILP